MHVFHGEAFRINPGWKRELSDIGLSANKDWTRLRSDDAVTASYRTTSNYRFTLKNGQSVYFKRYIYRRFRLKYWLQPSKATVEAAGYHELKNMGIHTIQTLAYGEKRRFGLLRGSFIVTLGIPDTMQLDQYLVMQWFNFDYMEKQKILGIIQSQLIMQLHTAHKAGFFHWDLKLRNIILRQDNDTVKLIWIDCPRSRIRNPNDRKGVIKDLAAMARVGVRVLTPGQRLRFLLEYTRHNRQEARTLYRDITQVLSKNPPRPYWQLLSKNDPVYITEHEKINRPS